MLSITRVHCDKTAEARTKKLLNACEFGREASQRNSKRTVNPIGQSRVEWLETAIIRFISKMVQDKSI